MNEPFQLADPKPLRRIVDGHAYKDFHATQPECLACGSTHAQAHHLLSRGQGGDDVLGNLIPLCRGCHSAYHGTPYRGAFGHKIDAGFVRSAIGRHLGHESGDDARAYLIGKLGRRPAEAYMRKQFGFRA